MTGPRMRIQSEESKKEMVCGICGYKYFTLKKMTLKDYTISSICQDQLMKMRMSLWMRVLSKMIMLIPPQYKFKCKCNLKWWSFINNQGALPVSLFDSTEL